MIRSVSLSLFAMCCLPLLPSASAAEVVPPAPPVSPPPVALVTPAAWLKTQPKPAFRAGYTLPRLTRYGWSLPLDARIEMTENWGYALEYGGYVGPESVTAIDTPGSIEAQIAALVKADPKRYPLAVICSRTLPGEDADPDAWTRDKDGKVINGEAKSMDGTKWSEGAGAIFSPEAPLSVWKLAGKYRADPLADLIKRGVPISIVLNGGEYGIGVPGFGQKLWSLDPKAQAAVAAEPFKGNWNSYVSARKASAEKAIADTVRAAVPDRQLYVYYTAGGETLRNKYWGQAEWGYDWAHMRGVSDLPSDEIYFNHFNDGFTGRLNLLSIALNATAAEIATGDTLSYNWICAGWPRGDEKKHCADLTRWTGFLKCYYTAGMVGANVGYYDFPPGGFDASFAPDKCPVYLQQMVASSQVHALFSQYEDLIRQGDLLPGPMKHTISPADPAYEFPTGDDNARVVVRKQRGKAVWLVTAWASDGADRTVTVRVPDLGRINVQARVCGSVYRASLDKGQVTLVQLDPEGATYTTVKTGKPLVAPVDLALGKPPMKGLLAWFSADAGITKDAAGKISAWKSQGPLALSLSQTDATHQPQWDATAVAGKPAVQGDGGNRWLGLQPNPAQAKAFSGPLTIITVFTCPEYKGDNRVLSALAAEGGSDWTRGKGFKMTDGMAEAVKTGEVAIMLTDAEITGPLGALSVGCMHSGGYTGFTGDIAEMLIYQGALSPSITTTIIDDLRIKYTPKVKAAK